MQQEWQKGVHTGHNVLDRNGNKIGTVRNVQEQARSASGTQMGGKGYVEVECNLPNTRKELYIPFDCFKDCTANECRLDVSQDDVANKGWDQKPTNR